MKHVSIIVPLGNTSLTNIDGTHQIFYETNKFLEEKGDGPLFKVQLVGIAKESSHRNGLFTVIPECLIGDVKKNRPYHCSCIIRRSQTGIGNEPGIYSLDHPPI